MTILERHVTEENTLQKKYLEENEKKENQCKETHPGPGLNPFEPLVKYCNIFLVRDKQRYDNAQKSCFSSSKFQVYVEWSSG